MAINENLYHEILNKLKERKVTLVAVSKTKSAEEILELYNLGQRDFGENYVQELIEKYKQLPKDIRWHFIGHLQSNKVKLIAPFVSLIQSVDSERLLKEINKHAQKNNRIINCLLQVYIAKEETKFGLDAEELNAIMKEFFMGLKTENLYKNICIKGLMGMASFTDDEEIVKKEFHFLKLLFAEYSTLNLQPSTFNLQPSTFNLQPLTFNLQPLTFNLLSMGMSADYKMAIEEGSNMVRIGSLLFGKRN